VEARMTVLSSPDVNANVPKRNGNIPGRLRPLK
jgi:hypothetical protein